MAHRNAKNHLGAKTVIRNPDNSILAVGSERFASRRPEQLSLATWNVSGIGAKHVAVANLIHNSNFDVFCLQETHHSKQKVEFWYSTKSWKSLLERFDIFWSATDYRPEHKDIADRNHYGCAMVVKKGLNPQFTQLKWHL